MGNGGREYWEGSRCWALPAKAKENRLERQMREANVVSWVRASTYFLIFYLHALHAQICMQTESWDSDRHQIGLQSGGLKENTSVFSITVPTFFPTLLHNPSISFLVWGFWGVACSPLLTNKDFYFLQMEIGWRCNKLEWQRWRIYSQSHSVLHTNPESFQEYWIFICWSLLYKCPEELL